MFNYKELREVVNNIEDKKDKWHINFVTKYLTVWIYEKIGQTEYQFIVNTRVEVLVCMKPMTDLLKFKLKADKAMIVVAIDEVK